jgi:hypothetical protein
MFHMVMAPQENARKASRLQRYSACGCAGNSRFVMGVVSPVTT